MSVAVGALCPGLSACGDSSTGTPVTGGIGATRGASTPATVAEAAAFARAVNLHSSDLPDMRLRAPERTGRKNTPRDRALAHCDGGPDPNGLIAKVNSASFTDTTGLTFLRSTVEVEPTQALARASYRVALRPLMLTCLKRLLPGALEQQGGRNHNHFRTLTVSRVPSFSVPDSFGIEIKTSVIVPGGRYRPVTVYVDQLGFVSGPAEISILALGTIRPVAREIEERLLSLLYSRARAHEL